MNTLKAIEQMIEKSGTNKNALSVSMGKDRNTVNTMFSRGSIPRVDTLAKMCAAMGYRIVLESDDDRIEIDPPE